MSVEMLQTLSLAAYIAAGVFLLISIALFFLLDVPKLVGDLSGATARKAIESIRQQNAETGDKAYKPSKVNAARGKTTDKITPSGKIIKKNPGLGGSPGTEKFATADLMPQGGTQSPTRHNEAARNTGSDKTTLLNENAAVVAGGDETTRLAGNETTILGGNEAAKPAGNETTILDGSANAPKAAYRDRPEVTFTLEVEMGFMGSTELIE